MRIYSAYIITAHTSAARPASAAEPTDVSKSISDTLLLKHLLL